MRIVCLTPETADILYRVGAADQVVGVSGFAPDPPDGEPRAVVSAFTTFRYDRIEALEPDLVIGFSDLQAEAMGELARRGWSVYLTNQRTLDQVLETVVAVGRVAGRGPQARQLAGRLGEYLAHARAAARQAGRPAVYFEEWPDPLICGIGWVSELIEAAGGRDVFADRARRPAAPGRRVTTVEVVERAPETIVASWCGKPVEPDEIAARPGWDRIPAVAAGAIHEMPGRLCLQPGPVLFEEGLPWLQTLFAEEDRRP